MFYKILSFIIPKFIFLKLIFTYKTIKTKCTNLALLKKIEKNEKKHRIAIYELKNKNKIKVAFLALHSSVWKYDELYNLLLQSEKYIPMLFLCPVVNRGHEDMLLELEKSELFFTSKGYQYIMTYDRSENTYLDIRKKYNPDIIFYTNPYNELIYEKYNINHFLDKLTCYVPYSYMVLNHDWAYNLSFHNLCWKLYYPNELYTDIAKKIMTNKGRNISVTGYPKSDEFFNTNVLDYLEWKNGKSSSRKIIWAPHHTIEEDSDYKSSNFFSICDFMVELCFKYNDKIEFAFKPHPLLRIKLYNHNAWGKKKTDDYFNKWEKMPNSVFIDDDYVNIFKTSDALIHDCASFTIEYLHVNKPALYICNNNTESYFSELGKMAFDTHYKSYNNNDIENFIEVVVINQIDIKKNDREFFFNKHLFKYKNASLNIFNQLNNL
jgi:hypothetical protein